MDEDSEPAAVIPAGDAFVLLDAAKTALGAGKLHGAEDLLAAIDLSGAEPYVVQEVLFQRLLLAGSFLTATGTVIRDAERARYGQSTYHQWLLGERAKYAAQFTALASQYLEETGRGMACDFVRFRLPHITAEHLQDTVLYADPQVLRAAVENWDKGKLGLGKGLIGTQARVALVLGAAAFYDLPQASLSIEAVTARLQAGVPLLAGPVLDWIAQTAADQASLEDVALRNVQQAADGRLAPLAAQAGTSLSQRWNKRNGIADPAPVKPVPAKGKRRSNKRHRKAS
jgi:hypothetical protein